MTTTTASHSALDLLLAAEAERDAARAILVTLRAYTALADAADARGDSREYRRLAGRCNELEADYGERLAEAARLEAGASLRAVEAR